MNIMTSSTPRHRSAGASTMYRSTMSLLRMVAAVLLAAITTSALMMIVIESIAEAQRQMSAAANGGLFDLIATIFLTMLNVIAAGAASAYRGGMIGLYAALAICLTYLIMALLGIRLRWLVAIVLAEAGAAAASYAAAGLDQTHLISFAAGAAIFGAVVGLLVNPGRKQTLSPAPLTAKSIYPTTTLLIAPVLVGLAALWFFLFSPLTTSLRSASMMVNDTANNTANTTEMTTGNSSAIVEIARLHANGVSQALFFPDGKQLAVAQAEGVVIYDVATWNPQQTIATGAAPHIAISPDGATLATTAANNAQLWRVSDGQLLFTLTGHSAAVEDLAFSPDGTRLATASLDRSIRLWRVSNGEGLYTLSHVGHVYSVDFRFDGQVLATGSDVGTTLWNPISGQRWRIADLAFAVVSDIAFSPDGATIAAAMKTGSIQFHDGPSYTNNHEARGQLAINTLAFSPNGQLLAYGGDSQIVDLLDVAANVHLTNLKGHQGAINSVAFSPDGRLLISTAQDGTLRVWGTEETPPPTATPMATTTPTALPSATPAPRIHVTIQSSQPQNEPAATSPLATPLASTTPTATATPRPTSTARPTNTPLPTATPSPQPTATPLPTPSATRLVISPSAIAAQQEVISPENIGQLLQGVKTNVGSAAAIAYAPDGKQLAVATNGEVVILDSTTLAQLGTIATPAGSLAFSPDGKLLLTANGTMATLWRVTTGEKVQDLELHGDLVTAVAFSPDGATLATASLDGLARLWRVSDGALLRQFSHFGGVHALAFSPNGQSLTTSTTVGAVQWRVSDGARLSILTLNPNYANRLRFSADGQILAAATAKGPVWLWQQGGAGKWLVLQGHTQPASDLDFSPDGQLLASASADGTVRLWRVSDGAALRTLTHDGAALTGVAFQPDGAALLTAAADGTLWRWALPLAPPPASENP